MIFGVWSKKISEIRSVVFVSRTVLCMEMLWFASGKKIESALIEGSLGLDSLLVPFTYWDRLSREEKKILPKRLPSLLRRYGKYIAAMKRLHFRAGKIKYNRGVGKMKKLSIRVNTGTWAMLGALAAAHGVSRCYLFNYMLWLEDVGVGDSIVETLNRGVPSFHRTYRMIWTLDLQQNLISRELKFKPNPMVERYRRGS
ncbi:PF07600 family protein [Leptospira weilii serovar Ranarum str. ICFT]|uniref:PF07600 family protein n=2 Tax=Leptospira weilii TaxID=28184 RepID=N1WMQ6_9LEPT|nr:PF07600 family protein [Leptospira weilii serovar Ranarum str. ICFT]